MAHPIIEAVRHLHISPLVTITHPTSAQHYEEGLAHSLFKEHENLGPLHDLYLVDMFTLVRCFGHFDGQHQQKLSAQIGLTLGEIHGGVLLAASGTLRPDVTTLVTLHDPDMKRGYRAGREFFFTEADAEPAWHQTEASLMERLCELAQDYDHCQDAQGTIRFSIGAILGELSGQLFPWTAQEHHAFQAESLRFLGYICPINPEVTPRACSVCKQCLKC
ncbi:MAG: hypothetical protein M3Z24_02010, partial [Chloroflexota bacterium]|nr:hypothetical protein [Chloroflexota bacterium]